MDPGRDFEQHARRRAAMKGMLVVVAVLGVVIWLRPEHELAFGGGREDSRQESRPAAPQAKHTHADLALEAIESELRETGRVVRARSTRRVRSAAEASEDGRTTAAIQAQLALDPRLSALGIDVSTTDGRVTLAGRVDSAADLLRAIEIAFRQASVRQVIATLQIARPLARVERPSCLAEGIGAPGRERSALAPCVIALA